VKEVETRFRGQNNTFYYHKASDRTFGQIVAGVGFPGKLPGYACILGRTKHEDRGLKECHVHLLAEVEDLAAGELLRKLADLQERYEAQEVYGFLDEQDIFYLSSWNGLQERRSQDTLYIQPPPYAEDDRLEYFIRTLQDRLRSGAKSLHLGEGSRLAQHFLALQPDEACTVRAKDFPALAAAGYAVAALTLWRQVDAKNLQEYAVCDREDEPGGETVDRYTSG
jgi:hypothetical protein